MKFVYAKEDFTYSSRKILRIILSAGIITGVLLILSCGSDDRPTGTTGPGVIKPLAIGNQWTYTFTDLDSNGDTNWIASDIVYTVTEDTTIDEESWFTISQITKNDLDILFCLETNRASGLWRAVYTPDTDLWFYLEAQYPTTVGQAYSYMPCDGCENAVVRVISVGEEVAVPDGKFQCIHYQIYSGINGDVVEDMYYARNVGLIKSILYLTQGSLYTELTSRDLK